MKNNADYKVIANENMAGGVENCGYPPYMGMEPYGMMTPGCMQPANAASEEKPSNDKHINKTPSKMAPSNMAPSNMAPSNMAPSNLAPSNVSPSNMNPQCMMPSNMMPSNMMPSNMMPSNMMPSNMNPQCMMPSNMMPSNMMPPNMMTSNMNPQCMMPSNMMPGQQVSPEYIPSNLMPPCMVNANMSPESYPAEIPIWSNNWYGRIPPESMAADPYTYPQNLPEALRLIRNAVAGEREDELFYDYLIKVAPGNEEKEIIRSIRDDEMKHNRMFRQIYFELTGQILPPPEEVQFEKPASYMAGIQKALFGELGAVERYRKILFAMQLRKHINMVTEILTDEIKHASKYNFLYTKGRR